MSEINLATKGYVDTSIEASAEIVALAALVSHWTSDGGIGSLSYHYVGSLNNMNGGSTTPYGEVRIDASRSSSVYGADTQTGYKVQMKGTNVIAYKRTA